MIAAGIQHSDAELKAGLNAILPRDLSLSIPMRFTDTQQSYQDSRDFVKAQTGVVLLSRNRLTLHAVTGAAEEFETGAADDELDNDDKGEGRGSALKSAERL